jgi:drug/metabolite transporter (DMT)-like permease
MGATTESQKDSLKLAVSAIIFAALALSLSDAVIKSISVSFPLWQIYVVRSVLVLPVLITLIKYRNANTSLLPKSIGWSLLRSIFLAVMWIAYYSALPHIKLSVAAAAFYTLPLFITIFSAFFVGEKVAAKGWLAIILGFAGVIVMLRPDTEGFNFYALLPIVSAILYALAMILTRTKCQNENPVVLSLVLNLTFIVFGSVASLGLYAADINPAEVSANTFLLGSWIGLGLREWVAIAILAAAILIGSTFTAVAYQSAPSSTVSTFDYTYLVFSIMWGILFFAELPDLLTFLGIGMIAAAGVMAVRNS